MLEKLPPLEVVAQQLQRVVGLAHASVGRTVVDRSSSDAGLKSALLGLLGWAVVEGHCVLAGLGSATPQGVAPNVRSMLETLITARYLTDEQQNDQVLEGRLERFFRGVRAAQVKLRNALDEYPILKKTFLVDESLAKREREELQKTEAALPPDQRLGNRHWSGLPQGLKSVAEAVKLGADYAVQYRVNSGSVHASRPWDTVRFDSNGLLVVPDLESNSDLAIPHAFDALRYLAWVLAIAQEAGTIALHRSEQQILSEYQKYMQSVDALLKEGIVGAGPVSNP